MCHMSLQPHVMSHVLVPLGLVDRDVTAPRTHGDQGWGLMAEQAPAGLRMRRQAELFVRQATARNRLPLDYSVNSLRVVDFIVDGLRKEAPTVAASSTCCSGSASTPARCS